MEPVAVLFWSVVAFEVGFILAYALLGWHAGAAASVLTGFCVIGALLQYALGATIWPAIVLTCAAVGFGWGADLWRRHREWPWWA